MKTVYSTFALICFAAAVAAQSPASVLKKAEKAMGGSKQIIASRGWSRTGSIVNPSTGVKGKFASQTAQPNRFHTVYDLDGIEFESGFNGKSGWQRDSKNGLQTLTGDASLLMQAEATYRNAWWLNYKKEKSKIASGGVSSVDGKPANVVRLNTAKGVEFKLFFDQTTNLLVREEILSDDVSRSYSYKDFRAVNGVKMPFAVTIEKEGQTLAVELNEIRPDANIAATVFDFPKISGEPLPDIAKLLTELQSNEDEVEKLLDQYSFTQRSTKREIGKDGVLRETESETYQLSFYKGNRIRRLIEKNGKPLSAGDQEDADKNAAKQVEEIEKDIAKKEKRAQSDSGPPSENSRRISIAEVLKASKLVNPQTRTFSGPRGYSFRF